MTKRNRIRRSLGWKAAANVIRIAVISGATAVCISYRAYRQNLEDQMTQTAENLSRAAAAQVTAESKAGDAGLRRLSADEYEHAEHAGAGAIQPRAGSHQNVSVFGAAALWRGAAGGDGYRHNRLHAAGADGAAAGGSMEVLKIVAYRDSHHIPTWVSVAKRLSSSDYFYPDGSPFCHSSRSSSNGNRSACLRHKQACSNKTPPLVFAHGFGHKNRAPIHPQCGTNRRSMYITIFNFICYNCMVLKTSAFFD